jgi:hypothetical protein
METISSSNAPAKTDHKIIVGLLDGTVIKGFVRANEPRDLKALARDAHPPFNDLDVSYLSDDGRPLDVDRSQIKAVFFVSSFKGDREHQPVRFYTNGPEIGSLWVEVGFRDGEIIEGCIQNSLAHLNSDGFFLQPSEPGGNNLLIYVNKAAIISYRVLGVRALDD